MSSCRVLRRSVLRTAGTAYCGTAAQHWFACPSRGLLAMHWSLRNAFSRPLFGLKPGSFGTFIIWRRMDNSPVTKKNKITKNSTVHTVPVQFNTCVSHTLPLKLCCHPNPRLRSIFTNFAAAAEAASEPALCSSLLTCWCWTFFCVRLLHCSSLVWRLMAWFTFAL